MILFNLLSNAFTLVTGLEILHLDSVGLGSFFDLFKLYFFLDFYPLTFYLLEIELNLYPIHFSFCGVLMFSFDLLRIDI